MAILVCEYLTPGGEKQDVSYTKGKRKRRGEVNRRKSDTPDIATKQNTES